MAGALGGEDDKIGSLSRDSGTMRTCHLGTGEGGVGEGSSSPDRRGDEVRWLVDGLCLG